MARVVLDAVAEAHLLHHLDVVESPLLEALLLEEAALLVEEVEPLPERLADLADRAAHLLLRRDVVRPRKDGVALERALHAAADGIDLPDRLDRIAEELDANRGLELVRGEDLDHVAAHAERAAVEVDVVSL